MLIAQLTDLHVRPVGEPANRVVETNAFAERALRAVASFRPRPDVVIITGDLTECGLDAEYANLASMLRHYLPMPVFVIPGNHDRREGLRHGLAHLPGVTSDPQFVQYAAEGHPVRLVMLDTLVPGAGHGELCAERLGFLERTLAAAPERPTIVAMHHPPFACGIGHMDRINLRNAEAFAAVIARHRQVERIICGHVHRLVVGRVAHAIASIAPSVAHQVELTFDPHDAGAFNFEPPAYQLHRWTAADGIVSHTVMIEQFPGPFPFVNDAEYPGASANHSAE
jgi:3',5'-cyclic AMP phosphodiesterase CpdA